MRTAAAAAHVIALLGLALMPDAPAVAAEGDAWTVGRPNVNVRSGPSTQTDVLMTVSPGDRIVEIAAKGDWFFVDFPDHGHRGWVYAPLLVKPNAVVTPTAAAPSPAPASEPSEAPAQESRSPEAQPEDDGSIEAAASSTDQESAAVQSFRETVAELNDQAVSVAGIDLFNDVRSTGGGGIQVLATDTWATIPEAGQSSYMNALFNRWQSMASELGPLMLQIVDPDGEVMMERSGS